MPTVHKVAIVGHSAEKMFQLVEDVEKYPEFLPWCSESAIQSKAEDKVIASLAIHKGPITVHFTTENRYHHPQWIDLKLHKGPFKRFHGRWHFYSLAENQCKITFDLHFELSNKLFSMTATPLIEQVANTILEAFVSRANQHTD